MKTITRDPVTSDSPLWLVRRRTISNALVFVALMGSRYLSWRCSVTEERAIEIKFGDSEDGGKVKLP